MKKLSIVLIITCFFNLSTADFQINKMLQWSWDNCQDQMNAYSNIVSTYEDDELLFECASLQSYEKIICEDQERLNKRHDVIKQFYYDCVVGYENFKNEQTNSCNHECYMQNFCKRFNKDKSDFEQSYNNYVKYQEFQDCEDYNIQNCNKNTMKEIEYMSCFQNEKQCCLQDQVKSLFFDFNGNYELVQMFLYIMFTLVSKILFIITLLYMIYNFSQKIIR